MASERDRCDAGREAACDADVLYPDDPLELGSESDGGKGGRFAKLVVLFSRGFRYTPSPALMYVDPSVGRSPAHLLGVAVAEVCCDWAFAH